MRGSRLAVAEPSTRKPNRFAREHWTGRQNSGIHPASAWPRDDRHETRHKARPKIWVHGRLNRSKSAHSERIYPHRCEQYGNAIDTHNGALLLVLIILDTPHLIRRLTSAFLRGLFRIIRRLRIGRW